MAGLMYKNFLLYRMELLVLGAFQLLVSTAASLCGISGTAGGTTVLYGCMFLLTGLVETGLFAPDEKQSARSFLCAAPTGVRGHIGSKYLLVLAVNLGVLICCGLTDGLVFLCTGDRNTLAGWILVVFFSVNMLLESFSLPFIVYFGANQGVSVKISTFGILALLAFCYALFGDISYFLSHSFLEALEMLFREENLRFFWSLMPFVGGFAFWLSCRLSVALFRKGSENYD